MINKEIQFSNKYDILKRSIYYWAGVYRTPIHKSMSYKELNPVIAIYEDEEKFKLTDVMEIHFIEMTKLIRDWQADKLDPQNDVLARWLLMLGMVDREMEKSMKIFLRNWRELRWKIRHCMKLLKTGKR